MRGDYSARGSGPTSCCGGPGPAPCRPRLVVDRVLPAFK